VKFFGNITRNGDNAATFKICSDNKLRDVYTPNNFIGLAGKYSPCTW